MENSKRKVSIVLTGNEGYGVKRVWETVIDGLIHRNFSIDAYVIDNPEFDVNYFNDFNIKVRIYVIESKGFKLQRKKNKIFNVAYSLHKIILFKKNISSVFENSIINGSQSILFQSPLINFSIPSKNRTRISYYWMMPNVISNDYLFSLNKFFYRWFVKKNDVVVFPNSNFTANSLGVNGIRSEVIYPGVPLNESYSLLDTNNSSDLYDKNKKISLCIAASLTPIKGHVNLIKSVRILKDKGFNVELIVCGGSTESQFGKHLQNLCISLGVHNNVNFLGIVNNVREIFQSCDVVVSMTSIAEGYGLSIVEAMMSGKPVLAHSLGGPQETVVDGETGWLIHSVSEHCIVSGIERCICDRIKWKKMGLNGKVRAEELFSEQQMLDKLEKWLR